MAQQCPVCGSGVPDGRTTCQICSAPLQNTEKYTTPAGLQTSAQQQAPARPEREEEEELVPGIPGLDRRPPAENPYAITGGETEVRVSLTGELVESQPPPPRYGLGPEAAAAFPGAPGPAAYSPQTRTRGTHFRPAPQEEAPPTKSKAATAVGIAFLILIAVGGGAGLWYWQMQRSPATAAARFMETFKAKDWKALADMIYEPPEQQNSPFSKAGKEMAIGFLTMLGSFITVQDYSIGEVTVNGDDATVKVTTTIQVSAFGQNRTETQTNELKLKRVDGVWKVSGLPSGGRAARGSGRPGTGGSSGFP